MYKICVFLIVAAAFLAVRAEAEEKFLEVYTFKKDRVDQEVSGNRGYIMGKAPEQVEAPRETQRTLIGVDIMVGVTDEDDETEDVITEPKKQLSPQKKLSKKKRSVNRTKISKKQPKNEKPVTVVEKVVIVEETEEDWIK
ncbi:MAG: hypothetical protein ABIH09_05120 [Candidatus Omnitrophota bacterium]